MNAGLSVYNMLFWRFLITAIIVVLFLAPNIGAVLKNKRANLKIIFFGMAFYSTSAIIYFIASKYIGTGLSMVIFFTYPAFVIFFNIYYHKIRVNRIYYLAFAFLAMGMIGLIDFQEFTFDLVGVGLGVLSAMLYAAYILANRGVAITTGASTLMVSVGCIISCFAAAVFDESFFVPLEFDTWMNIIYMAIICTALPILLFLKGLKYISSEQASMLSVLEPVFVVLLGVFVLNEPITTMQVIGATIVLAGALITLLPAGARDPEILK